MTSAPDFSIVSLVLQATLPVQVVMAILLLISIRSWTIIFQKLRDTRQVVRDSLAFEEAFWSSNDLRQLYEQVGQNRHGEGLARVFQAGMREFLKGHQQVQAARGDHAQAVHGAQRAMRAATQRELDGLERGLPFLATAGSISPYIGLFGTVWGIMHAFTGLANIQQATLASVAPGIAEALVATAIGLFAAIPAVVGYNKFATQIDRLSLTIDSFSEEFLNILQRQG